jgi:hypothetical protein
VMLACHMEFGAHEINRAGTQRAETAVPPRI